MNKDYLSKGLLILIGFTLCFLLFILTSAWKPVNVGGNFGNVSVVQICCSSDGNIIYVTDNNGVQKSSDGGNTWNYILTDKK